MGSKTSGNRAGVRSKFGTEWSERNREKMRSSNAVNLLIECAHGQIELGRERLKAIEIILKKTLPDLTSIELNGNKDAPIQIIINGKDANI